MLPVGTIYASSKVTFTDKAIITIINRAFTSDMNFLFPVLIPIQINPNIPQKIRVMRP